MRVSHVNRMAKIALVLLGVCAVGCGGSNQQKLVTMASSRWECPSSHIRVEKIEGETFRVLGCEHEATYECRDRSNGAGESCTRVSGF